MPDRPPMICLVYEPAVRSGGRGVVRLIAMPTEAPVLRVSALPPSGHWRDADVFICPRPAGRGNRKGQRRRARQALAAFHATHTVSSHVPVIDLDLLARQVGDSRGWACKVYASRDEWYTKEDEIMEAVNEWVASRDSGPHRYAMAQSAHDAWVPR